MVNTNKNIVIIGLSVDDTKINGGFNHISIIFHSKAELSDAEKENVMSSFNNTFHLRIQMAAMAKESNFNIRKAIDDTISIVAENNNLNYKILEADCCAIVVSNPEI